MQQIILLSIAILLLCILFGSFKVSGAASSIEEKEIGMKAKCRETRIDEFLHDLGYYWKLYSPDFPFGRWIMTMFKEYENKEGEAIAFAVEGKILDFIREYYEGE